MSDQPFGHRPNADNLGPGQLSYILGDPGARKDLETRVKRAGGPNITARLILYPLLWGLAFVGMNGTVFTLAIYLLILPAILLVVVVYAALYLPLIDWPLTAWRLTGKRWPAVAAALVALLIPIGLPAYVNLQETKKLGRPAAYDITAKAPLAPPRTILFSGCAETCVALFASGAIDHALVSEVVSSWGATGVSINREPVAEALLITPTADCRDDPETVYIADRRSWCLTGHKVPRPRYDAMIVERGARPERRIHEPQIHQVAVYACPSDCTPHTLQTEFARTTVKTPVSIAFEGGALVLDPILRRSFVMRGNADPVVLMNRVFGYDMALKGPRFGAHPDVSGGMPGIEALHAARQAEGAARLARNKAEAAENVRKSEADRQDWLAQRAREQAYMDAQHRDLCKRSFAAGERHMAASCLNPDGTFK